MHGRERRVRERAACVRGSACAGVSGVHKKRGMCVREQRVRERHAFAFVEDTVVRMREQKPIEGFKINPVSKYMAGNLWHLRHTPQRGGGGLMAEGRRGARKWEPMVWQCDP